MGRLLFHRIKIYGYHGVYEQEQSLGNAFIIDLDLSVDFSRGIETDRCEDVVDYRKVYTWVQDVVQGQKFYLLEKLADAIGRRILAEDQRVAYATVRVSKAQYPFDSNIESIVVEHLVHRYG